MAAMIIVGGLGIAAWGAPTRPAPTQSVDSAIGLLMNQKYIPAQTLLMSHVGVYPDDLRARYLLFAIEQTRLLDYELFQVDGPKLIKSADNLTSFLLKKLPQLAGRDSLDCLFYLGNAYGGRGIVHAKNNNWFAAIGDIYRSLAFLNAVVARDSSYYAAYLGLGIFDYYLSQNLKWLPFYGDRSARGIERIVKATQARSPYEQAAFNQLCWIYVERGMYTEADSIGRIVLERYPDNSVFIRIAGSIRLWSGRYREAIPLGTQLVTISLTCKPINWANLLMGHWIQISSYDNLEQSAQCRKVAAQVAAYTIPAQYRKTVQIQELLGNITSVASRHGAPKVSK